MFLKCVTKIGIYVGNLFAEENVYRVNNFELYKDFIEKIANLCDKNDFCQNYKDYSDNDFQFIIVLLVKHISKEI